MGEGEWGEKGKYGSLVSDWNGGQERMSAD